MADQDLVTLMCLHGKTLFLRQTDHGIIHYQHEDGSGCDYYNSFSMDADKLALATYRAEYKPDNSPPTPALVASYLSSLPVRLIWYGNMTTDDELKLQRLLERVLVIMDGADNKDYLAWEMVEIFGGVVAENVRYITGSSLGWLGHGTPTYREDETELPEYHMLNLLNDREDSDQLDLDGLFAKEAERQERRRQRFSS